ncbi:MAG TPA: archaeosortase/exosortase family protein [Opitutaceae bacterium]|nr:archaeosortase/exosortase family protein [Opitutaceae bacterium]
MTSLEPTFRRFRDVALRRWVLTVVALCLGREVFAWYWARALDGSDEPLGVLALVAAILLAPRKGWGETLSLERASWAGALLLTFLLSGGAWPILLRALVWVMALAVLVAPHGRKLAWGTLCVLSLPWLATVQFFLGYPLRVAITWVAAAGLNVFGLGVHAEATVLMAQGERVLIDAPCSGIQMGWTLAFFAAVLANVGSFGARETWRLLRWASALVFAANTLRAMALFLLEIRFHVSEEWVHNAVGLACFAFAGAGLLAVGRRRRKEEGRRLKKCGASEGKPSCACANNKDRMQNVERPFGSVQKRPTSEGRARPQGEPNAESASDSVHQPHLSEVGRGVSAEPRAPGLTCDMSHSARAGLWRWLGLCVIAAAVLTLAFAAWQNPRRYFGPRRNSRSPVETTAPGEHKRAADRGTTTPASTFPGWDAGPLPPDCVQIPLGERDARFVRGFPGRIAAFSDGERQFIARWVAQPTRKLHSSSDCLRGSGYKITPGPAHRDALGRLWSSFGAVRGTERLHVEERIEDTTGQAWTDVSAWYWSALLQKSPGPWWAVTVVTPVG